jgi:hypothetical protein
VVELKKEVGASPPPLPPLPKSREPEKSRGPGLLGFMVIPILLIDKMNFILLNYIAINAVTFSLFDLST